MLVEQLQHQDDASRRKRMIFGGFIFGSTVIGTLALTAPFVFTKSPLPYMATPGRKVFKALRHLAKDHPLRTFVDMGSGDGEAVYQALQAGYHRAVGIELKYTLYAIAQLRRQLFWTADERARSTFLCQDFFQYNLEQVDTVMIFGVNPLMKPLSKKLEAECRPGTHILSYRFLLPTQNETLQGEEDHSSLLRASIVYEQEEMRLYRRNGEER